MGVTLLALPLAVALALGGGAPAGPSGARQDEAWRVAREAPDGPERTAALVASLAPETLATLSAQARFERLDTAYRAFLGAEERIAGEELLALAQAMHGAEPAPWSAFCLEGALRRVAGRYDEADALLAALGERVASDPDASRAVLERRALVAAGEGDRGRERALLAGALARGSSDARQILGFAALRAGDRTTARVHFGALLAARGADAPAARDLPPWALRGHGLALLPRSAD